MDRSSNQESGIGAGLASSPVNNNNNNNNILINNSSSSSLPTPRGHSDTSTNNAKHNERSAVVLALFGPAVGPCVGDFSTTYFRANGRLYAASYAILFYSNLFGFERRLCLRFSDIESIEAYRSTSIKISMVDCEDHLFRKFVNRDLVLQLLNDLHRNETGAVRASSIVRSLVEEKDENSQPRTRSSTQDNFGDSQSIDDDFSRERIPSETSPPDAMAAHTIHLRQRSQSMPSMEALEVVQADNNERALVDSPAKRRRVFRRTLTAIATGKMTPTRTNSDIPEASSGSDTPVVVQTFGLSVSHVSSPSAPPNFDMQAAWTKATIPYSDVALDSIILPCSLEGFMDLFFSNEASFPISRYQREVIKDREVHYAKWKKSSTTFPPVFDRDISFVHPLSNPLGPAEAKTSRQQRFQRFGTLGATLQNTTNIQGVPGADCFKVEDRWVVETLSDNSVRFTVYFQIDFFKRTMIKALIQKNVKTETKKWFQGYVNFINRALHEDSDRKGRPQSPIAASYGEVDKENFSETLEHRDAAYFRVGGLTTICVVLLVVATLFAQLLFLRRNVRDLQDQVTMMRQDTLEVRAMLQQIVAFQK